MFICKSCGKEFEIDWRRDKRYIRETPIPAYCGIPCSRSRVFTQETKNLKSLKTKEFNSRHPEVSQYARLLGNSETAIEKRKYTWRKKEDSRRFEDLGRVSVKKRLLMEQNNCCDICNMPGVWMEKPMIFELDHIDGNKLNNNRSNLRLLCPNCHSQTPTWRGKSRKSL